LLHASPEGRAVAEKMMLQHNYAGTTTPNSKRQRIGDPAGSSYTTHLSTGDLKEFSTAWDYTQKRPVNMLDLHYRGKNAIRRMTRTGGIKEVDFVRWVVCGRQLLLAGTC
jgi:hypothetical protein